MVFSKGTAEVGGCRTNKPTLDHKKCINLSYCPLIWMSPLPIFSYDAAPHLAETGFPNISTRENISQQQDFNHSATKYWHSFYTPMQLC